MVDPMEFVVTRVWRSLGGHSSNGMAGWKSLRARTTGEIIEECPSQIKNRTLNVGRESPVGAGTFSAGNA